MHEVVHLENAGLRYGTGAEALSDLDIRLAAGSLHVVTGPPGAGKSSLLALVATAVRPSRGVFRLFGADATAADGDARAALRRRIGRVAADVPLVPGLSLTENVALPLRVAGVAEAAFAGDVAELLALVGLGGRGATRPEMLSEVERRQAELARAVAARPDLVCADALLDHADPPAVGRMVELLAAAAQEGAAVLVAAADPLPLLRAGAEELHLARGRLVEAARGGDRARRLSAA